MTKQEEKKTPPQSISSDFKSILDTIQDVYYRADSEGYLTIASRSLATLLGYADISDCLGRKVDTFYADLTKRELFLDTLRSSGKVTRYEVALLHCDGSWVIVETSSHILHDPENNYLGVEGTFRDITEQKRMEQKLHQTLRARTAIGEVNRLRYELSDEDLFIRKFCEILVSVAGYRMAWIGKKETNTLRTVTPIASAGDVGDYLTHSLITWGYETTGMGPTGTAIRINNQVICRYIQTDPFFAPWRDEAIERGYASSIAIPIRIIDEVFGSLNIYSADPDAFNTEEQDLLEEITRDLAVGIASIRDQQIQKRMTTALHESEEKYHQLFRSSVAGFALHEIICDQSGTPVDYRFLEVNPAFEQLTGLRAEDIIGQTVLTVLPGIEHSWIETYGQVALTGETIRYENYSKDLNKYYDVTAYSPIEGHFVTLFLDITDRKRAETALLESEERLRVTLDAINDGIWDWNIPSGNVFFSPRWYTMLGYEVNELPGSFETWKTLVHPDDRISTEQKILDHILQKDEEYKAEFRMQTKEGGWRWILARGRVIDRNVEGNPVRMVGTHSDITDRKQIQEELAGKHLELMASYEQIAANEEELRQNLEILTLSEKTLIISEERLLMAQEISHTGCWEFNPETNNIWGSAEALRIYGISDVSGEVPIEEVEACVQDPETVHKTFIDFLTGKKEYNTEIFINPADGSAQKVVHSIARLEKDEEGNIRNVIGVIQDITNLKKAETALRESEKTYRNLYQYAQVGLFETSYSDALVMACNQRYADLAGFPSVKEAIGKNILINYADHGDREEVRKLLQDQGYVRDHIVQFINQSTHELFWGQFSARYNAERNVIEGSIIDISKQKVAEEHLRKSETLLNQTQEITNIGGWEYDVADGCMRWTTGVYRIHELPEDYDPNNISDDVSFYAPEYQETVRQALRRAVHEGEPYNLDLGFISAKGTHKWIRTMAQVEQISGKVLRVYGTILDITDQKKFEDALRDANSFLENLITLANVPIIVWNPDFIITRINHAFELLIGRSASEVLGKSLEILYPAPQVDHSMQLIRTTLDGVRWETVEIDLQHQDGSIRTVIWNSSTLYTPDGVTPIATIAQGQDITTQRGLEQDKKAALEQIQQNIAQLSLLNDGIRNPLTIILGYLDLLSESTEIDIIRLQTQRIDDIVTQLDKRWIDSEKILTYLRKHYQIEFVK